MIDHSAGSKQIFYIGGWEGKVASSNKIINFFVFLIDCLFFKSLTQTALNQNMYNKYII